MNVDLEKPVWGKHEASSVSLRYRLHFIIFLALTAFLLIACVYPMIATGRPIWQVVGKPVWLVIPIEVLSLFYCLWMTLVASYELKLTEGGLVVTRPWGRSRKYDFAEITKIIHISRRTSLIRINLLGWIPLSGLTADGDKYKMEIEVTLGLRRSPSK